MASFVFNNAKKMILDGDIHFDTDDIRLLLLEATTGIVIEDDELEDLNLATTELNSTGYVGTYDYASGGVALSNQANSIDDTDDEAVFDSSDTPTWSSISQAGSETVVAILMYLHVDGTAANDIAIAFIDDYTGLPLTPNGSDITITFAAEGILNLNDA